MNKLMAASALFLGSCQFWPEYDEAYAAPDPDVRKFNIQVDRWAGESLGQTRFETIQEKKKFLESEQGKEWVENQKRILSSKVDDMKKGLLQVDPASPRAKAIVKEIGLMEGVIARLDTTAMLAQLTPEALEKAREDAMPDLEAAKRPIEGLVMKGPYKPPDFPSDERYELPSGVGFEYGPAYPGMYPGMPGMYPGMNPGMYPGMVPPMYPGMYPRPYYSPYPGPSPYPYYAPGLR